MFRGLWNGIVNPGPRGKVRRAFVLVIILALFTGLTDWSKPWNVGADKINGWVSRAATHRPQQGKLAPVLQWLGERRIGHFPERPFRLGLDLQGGAHLVYEADISQIASSERDNAVEGVRDVIERRVNAFGVAEPLVQTSRSGNSWRVVVELAGVKDIKQAIKQIGETPVLEFKEEGTPEPSRVLTVDEKRDMEQYNKAQQKKVDELITDLKASAEVDFMILAKKYSEDKISADFGGSIGWITRDSAYPELWQWANDRGVGIVSLQPIQTQEGWNVIQVKSAEERSREVHAQHILICYRGATRCEGGISKDEARKKVEELKKLATPENFEKLARENSTEPSAKEQSGDLGFFSDGAMVKPFNDAVFALKNGAIDGPVETEFGFHLIRRIEDRPLKAYNLNRILIKQKREADYLPPPEPFKNTGLSGKHLARSVIQFDNNTNTPEVGLEFNAEGQKLFGEITSRNVGKLVAIFLDGQAISVPRVQTAITDGRAVITGNFTVQDAKLLAQRLNAGALPVPINLVSQQTVGATLGSASIRASLLAGLIGFALVALFMVAYYRVAGVIAIIALLVYSAIVLALFKWIPVTLTLSGIAGFILSIGMAVDTNVLQFERLKEELQSGKPLGSAVEDAFIRAWPSIRDSHVTTLLGALILFWFSTSLVKGFGLTLAVGVLVSLFSAISVTRVLLRLIVPHVKNPRWYGTRIKR